MLRPCMSACAHDPAMFSVPARLLFNCFANYRSLSHLSFYEIQLPFLYHFTTNLLYFHLKNDALGSYLVSLKRSRSLHCRAIGRDNGNIANSIVRPTFKLDFSKIKS